MKNKLLSMILITALCLTMVTPALSAPDTGAYTSSTAQSEVGTDDGKLFGEYDGYHDGAMDYYNNLMSDVSRHRLKTEDIMSKYYLKTQTAAYYNTFVAAYKKAYDIAYHLGFEEANTAKYTLEYDGALNYGSELGGKYGAMEAIFDLTLGLSEDWSRSYQALIKGTTLVNKFSLGKFSTPYQRFFEQAFKNAYHTAYFMTYQDYHFKHEMNNVNYEFVSMMSKTLIFDQSVYQALNGEITDYMVKRAWIAIPQGAVYEDAYVGLHRMQNSFNHEVGDLIPVSSVYTVSVKARNNRLSLYEPMTLNFPYYGSDRVGVYEWRDNTWVFLGSDKTTDSVSVEIAQGLYKGGQYALFIDPSYIIPKDLTFSWAYEDVVTSIRRGYTEGTSNFRPNDKITRGELATLLYKTLAHRRPVIGVLPKVEDASAFGNHKEGIEYVMKMRWMLPDKAGNFNPNQTVSYEDLENIISVIELYSFDYNTLATKLFYTRFQESDFKVNPKLAMTRAEMVFALNEVFR